MASKASGYRFGPDKCARGVFACEVVVPRVRASIASVDSEANVCVEVPGEIAYRHVVLRAVAALCKVASERVSGRRAPAGALTQQVVSAVGEAFNNIVLHCYRDRESDIVRVRMRIQANILHVTVEDFGSSFDPATAPLPDLEALPESGLGIFIMRSLMDEVSYRPGRPNVLTLSKRIQECPAGLPKISGRRTTDGLLHD
jgi:serine/threonine-protein kinase RsbW